MTRKSSRTTKLPAHKRATKPKRRAKKALSKKTSKRTTSVKITQGPASKKTTAVRSKASKPRTARKLSLLDRIQLHVAPANGKPDRLVMATMGKVSHRDTINTNKAAARERFLKGLAERTGLSVDELHDLHQPLQDKADEADAGADAQADELQQPKGDDGGGRPSQATQLVQLADSFELFHTPDGEAYATINVHDHRETWLLRSKGLRRWLGRLFFATYRKSPGAQALQDALGVLELSFCKLSNGVGKMGVLESNAWRFGPARGG